MMKSPARAQVLVSLFSNTVEEDTPLKSEKGKRANKVTNSKMNPKNLSDVKDR